MGEQGTAPEISRLLEAQQLRTQIDAKGRVRIQAESGAKLVKRIHLDNLREQAFILKRAIPGLCLHRRAQVFSIEEQLYQVIDLDPELAAVNDAKDALGIVQLYTHADCVAMLTQRLDLEALVESSHTHYHFTKQDGHPRAREASLAPLIELFRTAAKDLWPHDESRFRSGLFHEDLQTGNLLAGRGLLHVIDLDPLWHSYSILNLAHFFVMEVVARQRAELFEPLRAHFLAALREESERDFDFFVLLALYRVLVRRAFHRDYFGESLHRDFTALFDHFGQRFYLGRLRGGR